MIARIKRRLMVLAIGATLALAAQASLRAAEDSGAKKEYLDYLASVVTSMRASRQPEQRTLAALLGGMLTQDDPGAEIARLGSENADNRKVLWMIANLGDRRVPLKTRADAIAALQLAESDNAAAWVLSLTQGRDIPQEIADETLRHMARSSRFDTRAIDVAASMLDAMQGLPVPQAAMDNLRDPSGRSLSQQEVKNAIAFSVKAALATPALGGLLRACKPGSDGTMTATRREDCVATGHLLVQRSTDTIGLTFGDSVLRALDARDAADADRVAHVMWWRQISIAGEQQLVDGGYLDDYVADSDEIAALKNLARRLDKIEPPAGWSESALANAKR